MNKEIKKIFLVLFCYALSGGIFYNFQELWMIDNKLSTKTIGIVFSLCALLTVSTIFLCSNLISRRNLKKFSKVLILLKAINLLALFILNNSGLNVLIKFLIMVDYVIDTEIWASIYPMMACIKKSDKIFALRELVYSYAYYSGILLSSLLLGKVIGLLNITYNSYCLIGSILMFVAYFILCNTNLEQDNTDKNEKNNQAFYSVIKKIKTDKITQNYLGFTLFGDASYNCINGLLIILLTTGLGFSASGASNLKLTLGIVGVLIATLILNKFTLKNDYINISIKYIGRLILYLIAFLTNNKIFFLLSIIYARLLAESYYHVTDAPYVNRFDADEQLAFCNLLEMVSYLAISIGNLLCGIALSIDTKYVFCFALLFLIFQLVFGFNALRLRKLEKRK